MQKINKSQSNWQTVKLSDVTEYVNRGVPPVYTQDNAGTAVVSQKCIRDGQVNFDLSRLTDESTRQVPQDKLVQPYDILINSTGTGTVGRVAQVVDLTKRTTVDSHVTIVRPKKEVVDPIYLGYWMKTKQEELEGLASGSTNQVELPRLKIAEVNVILPPISTQKKISEIIAALDSAITKTDQIIQKTEVLKKGLMQELLTKGIGHKKFKNTKIGEIPEKWELYSLGDLCNFITGKLNSNQGVIDGKYPFFTCAQETLAIDRYSFDCEAVLLAGNNASGVYSVKYYKGKFNAYQRTYIITIKDTSLLDYFFLKEILNIRLNLLKDFSVGTNTKFLTLKLLLGIKVLLPPINEQIKISNILMGLESKIHKEMQKRNALLNLKKGLMQDIFSQKVQIN